MNCVIYLFIYGNNFVSLLLKYILILRLLKYLWCMRGVVVRLFVFKIFWFIKEKVNYKYIWIIYLC